MPSLMGEQGPALCLGNKVELALQSGEGKGELASRVRAGDLAQSFSPCNTCESEQHCRAGSRDMHLLQESHSQSLRAGELTLP